MLFPWLPNSAVKAKDKALREVYTMLSDIIDERSASGSTDQDALQVLIELGDSTPDVIAVSCGVAINMRRNRAEFQSTVCSWDTFRWNYKHWRERMLVTNVSQR